MGKKEKKISDRRKIKREKKLYGREENKKENDRREKY